MSTSCQLDGVELTPRASMFSYDTRAQVIATPQLENWPWFRVAGCETAAREHDGPAAPHQKVGLAVKAAPTRQLWIFILHVGFFSLRHVFSPPLETLDHRRILRLLMIAVGERKYCARSLSLSLSRTCNAWLITKRLSFEMRLLESRS